MADVKGHCTDHTGNCAEIRQSSADNADQWKAITALRESVYRRPSWYTTAIISGLIGVCGYLFAKLDDARGIESKTTVQFVRIETRLDSMERQLLALTSRPHSTATP